MITAGIKQESLIFTRIIQMSLQIPKLFWKKNKVQRRLRSATLHSLLWKRRYWTANMGTTTFASTSQRVNDFACREWEKLDVTLQLKSKPSSCTQNIHLPTYQGKVHARQIKHLQANQLELLRKAIARGDEIQTTTKYFISLPSEAAHSGHPTGNCAGFAQRIHPLLSGKICELVVAGITDTNEVQRSLRFYANNTLCKEMGYQTKQNDRVLYPTLTDIWNHVYSAMQKNIRT